MEKKNNIFAIDAGTLSIKMVYSENGHIHRIAFKHHGEPDHALNMMLEKHALDLQKGRSVVSGKYASLLSGNDDIVGVSPAPALVNALKHPKYRDIRYIVDIGSSGLAMAEVIDGSLKRYETNSLCAAGTGAFLDQQMHRLGLSHDTIHRIPVLDNPPVIASRCSVFAKSDLIHRQQAGYTVEQLWNGLVKGLSQSAFTTLFRGTKVEGPVMLIGGLTKNKVFLHYFESLLDGQRIIIPEQADYFLAEALYQSLKEDTLFANGQKPNHKSHKQHYEKPLLFRESKQAAHVHYNDDYGNEVDLYKLSKGETLQAYVGVDIGSTSTKMALLDTSGDIRLGLYARTKGRPVEAFQRLLHGLYSICQQYDVTLMIQSLGTTGSGRKLVGAFAGADMIKNEITAHLQGAMKEYPDVKTIIEIGGQDAKYIRVENGWMADANMNYVCAAGTGSFLEEQAANLNIHLDEISMVCKEVAPPYANHRCTVFMEQDANQLLAKGLTKSQVMASILYAVCKNYLHRVVQHRPVEEPILFLGATAKNAGLVEAFQNVLNKTILTSQHSHLMGAIGMAEVLRKEKLQETKFKGIEIKDVKFNLSEECCKLCNNHCQITRLTSIGGETLASWGYQCGREEGVKPAAKNKPRQPLSKMATLVYSVKKPLNPLGTIYFPQVLHYFSYNPFWQAFFYSLGIELSPVTISNPSSDSHSTRSLTDCCYPVKLATDRVFSLAEEGKTPFFLPYHLQDEVNPKAAASFFCPLSQAFPSLMKSTFRMHNRQTEGIIAPVIDFSREDERNIKELKKSLGHLFSLKKGAVEKAWQSAKQAGKQYIEELHRQSTLALSSSRSEGKPVFVLIGRSYNLLDDMLNLGLPEAISQYGYTVLPLDMLPVSRKELPNGYEDMYWSYGQKIVVAAQYIRRTPGLYPIFLTNFNCGPDSFLLGVFEREMQKKPALILELDEHGGDGGYITRLEAFFDRVDNHYKHHNNRQEMPVINEKKRVVSRLTDRKVYIPPMHPVASRLMSAGLRGYGIESVALDKEDAETYALGSSFTRGSECMPAASTIGSFIHRLAKEQQNGTGHENSALFMPCTNGPCRFGQYARLHDKILQSQDFFASIVSPNSDDHYSDITGPMRKHLFKALMVSDILDKLKHKIRPYEKDAGITDRLMQDYVSRLEGAFEDRADIKVILRQLCADIRGIRVYDDQKPLVGVVGEIYVRNSPFSNANLVETIEAAGGEAWVAPIMEWLHYTSGFEKNRNLSDWLHSKIANGVVSWLEKSYLGIFGNLLKSRREPSIKTIRRYGKEFLPDQIEGESILTIGRSIAFMQQGADLVLNVSPFGCMPGNISASILKDVSRKYGIPLVSLFFDGEVDFSGILETYIGNVKKAP
ncbi:MAG: hypothetical protein EA394_07940 [Bacteroidia bacterium]|nr:MAG: hypothetical protein EA394_07940 [Bacteroidia bacterium]